MTETRDLSLELLGTANLLRDAFDRNVYSLLMDRNSTDEELSQKFKTILESHPDLEDALDRAMTGLCDVYSSLVEINYL